MIWSWPEACCDAGARCAVSSGESPCKRRVRLVGAVRLPGVVGEGAASAVGPDILDGGDPLSGGSDVPQGSLPCAASRCCWRLRLVLHPTVYAAGEFAASVGGVLAVHVGSDRCRARGRCNLDGVDGASGDGQRSGASLCPAVHCLRVGGDSGARAYAQRPSLAVPAFLPAG